MSKQILRLIITSAPGEEEGGRGVRRHVGQLARHREGEGRDLLPESQRRGGIVNWVYTLYDL